VTIVDAHVHVVSADRARYPLRPAGVGSDWYLTAPVDLHGLRAEMTAADVGGAVLVQAYGAYTTDNSYVLDAGQAAGLPVVVIARSADDLRALVHERGARGVRLFAIGGGGTVDDESMWSAAGDLGVPVVVATLPDGLPALLPMLRRFPDVAVALDHCGFADDVALLEPLVPFEQLHLKVTPHVVRLVDRLWDRFGSRRLLWGTDFPQTHDRPYRELVDLGRRTCAHLTSHEQAAFLGGTAGRLWPTL
jgi:predicted TIM-barrel fold metal-dependent hydrolase